MAKYATPRQAGVYARYALSCGLQSGQTIDAYPCQVTHASSVDLFQPGLSTRSEPVVSFLAERAGDLSN
jgi:hypothetical protein